MSGACAHAHVCVCACVCVCVCAYLHAIVTIDLVTEVDYRLKPHVQVIFGIFWPNDFKDIE